MEAYGAEVIRISGNYDDSVKEAASGAINFGRIIVSDTSYEGYMEIPKFVALGYTVMLKEIIEQLEGEIPTHVFLQGGVGGLASIIGIDQLEDYRTSLGLNSKSEVLVIGTEGDTDPELYQSILNDTF